MRLELTPKPRVDADRVFGHLSPNGAAVAIVAAAACSVYASALGAGLVYDDLAAVRDNRDIRPSTPISTLFSNDFWGTPIHKEQSHKSYRPLTVLTFRFNFAVHGLDPFGYHVVNVLLHCLVCLLYHRVCLSIVPAFTSLLAALLFSVHPIHTEAVTSVVGRAELLSALFFLSALIYYIGGSRNSGRGSTQWRRCLITIALASTAMLCKEQGLTVIALCCVYELLSVKSYKKVSSPLRLVPSHTIQRVGALVLSGAVASLLRLHLNGIQPPTFDRLENPASIAPWPVRQLTYNYLVAINAWLLVFPCDLCCDWTMGTVPLVTSFKDARNLATAATYTILVLTVVATSRTEYHVKVPLTMALAMLVIPYLPASHLLFPVGFVVAERVLYLPSMGFCLLVALGFSRLCHHRYDSNLLKTGLVVLLASHATKTFLRNYDWCSEQSLYGAALRVNQKNAKMFNNMGRVLESLNRHQEAYMHYKKAIQIQPNDIRSQVNLGRSLAVLNRHQEAEVVLRQALSLFQSKMNTTEEMRVTSSHLRVYLSLASLISQNASRLQEADQLYKQAISLRSDFADAYISRADFLLRRNRTKEAQDMYEKALELDENNPSVYHNLGVVLMNQGRSEDAITFFNRAVELDPHDERTQRNSVLLAHQRNASRDTRTDYDRSPRGTDEGEHHERTYFHMAMTALEKKDAKGAERWFRKAIMVQPDLRSALFNLALLLSEQQRPMEALRFLTELLKYHPNHIEGLVLLGDINVNFLKDLEAAELCYQRILMLDPRHVQGSHNLCVIYVERGELLRAETCFRHATTLDPNAEYIRRHLEVTQSLLRNQSEESAAIYANVPSTLKDITSSSTVR